MRTVHVKIGKRTFVVKFDDEGEPISIRERKPIARFGVGHVFDYSYWHSKNHKMGGPNSVVASIIREAKEKL